MDRHTPTFNELLKAYPEIAAIERMKSDRPCETRVRNIICGVTNICRALELSFDSPITALTRPRIDRYLAAASERDHASTTAWTYVLYLRGLTARWTQPYYSERGWRIKPFDLPVCHKKPTRYIRPDRASLLKIKDWYDSLYIREDKRDWLAVTLMLEFAMRNGDAARLRWSDFRYKDGQNLRTHDSSGETIPFLCYTPHKTSLTSGRIVAWPVHPDIWDRFVSIRDSSPERAGTHFQGLVLPAANEVYPRLNKEIRELHFFSGTHKCCYEFRKICIDHIYQKFGAEMASSISGDDIKTVTRYYADPSAVNVTGVRIIDLL